ncbi:hypothetical protein DB31_3457 [Hyalangium minutum]|uniref:Uncharacterized protein n=1 Tax=Hyalangium minutum TaxID=394096 RepID=A0A085WUG4_9BACT|nr:hypothetical protein DB31_3457 [Hyalangium minutum]
MAPMLNRSEVESALSQFLPFEHTELRWSELDGVVDEVVQT